MNKISLAIICSMAMIFSTPLLKAQAPEETKVSENPIIENKPCAQKPIIIENSNAVMTLPLKPVTPISAATPLKALVNRPAMNIKAVIKDELLKAKIRLAPIITKYNHLLPRPIGAVSQKPILDAAIITENSNAETHPPIKTVGNKIINDLSIPVDCSHSLINSPLADDQVRLKNNPPFIQKRFPSELFPDAIYVMDIPTKEQIHYHTPVSCVPICFHHDWCQRYPGECEKNLEKRKKAHAQWCAKHPAACRSYTTAIKGSI